MRVYKDISLENFEAWSGAVATLEAIKDAGKCDELETYMEEMEPADGWSETAINDFLWFEDDYIFELLGISPENEEEE